MDPKENLENLFKDIQDIGKLVENLINNSNVSPVDLDFLKARVNGLYDSVLGVSWRMKLDKTEDAGQGITPVEKRTEKIEKIPEEPTRETIVLQESVSIEEIDEISKEKQEDLLPPPAIRIGGKTSVLSDKYQNKQKYRNEALKNENPVQDIASRIHDQAISDIGAAIGINEKFRYIRELFEGNSSLYKKTIDSLNNAESEADAIAYLQENFSWDPEEKLAKSLLDLTKRKLKNREND